MYTTQLSMIYSFCYIIKLRNHINFHGILAEGMDLHSRNVKMGM